MEERKQNITIRIADVAPISLTISPDHEELVRVAERKVNMVWQKWRQDFQPRTSKEVLAMVAYHFANRYFDLLATVNKRDAMLRDFESELNRLLEIGDTPSSSLHRDIAD